MKNHFDLSSLLRVGVLVLVLVSALPAAAAEASVQSQIAEANRLYEDLEYEQALERIQAARRASPTQDERVTLQVHSVCR